MPLKREGAARQFPRRISAAGGGGRSLCFVGQEVRSGGTGIGACEAIGPRCSCPASAGGGGGWGHFDRGSSGKLGCNPASGRPQAPEGAAGGLAYIPEAMAISWLAVRL